MALNSSVSGAQKLCRAFDENSPLSLEHGGTLSPIDVAYETYGTYVPNQTPVILICHALTAGASAAGEQGWWSPLIGNGKIIDTNRFFVICSNVLGSCYGTTGPHQWRKNAANTLPTISIRDMVRVQATLLDKLNINEPLYAVIGGSMGGMQALEWAVMYPERVQRLIAIATCIQHSAWAIGLNRVARHAIMSDPAWQNGHYQEQPAEGFALARMVAMLSYRHKLSFDQRFGRETNAGDGVDFEICSYLDYQGKKLVSRFDANAYLTLTRAMDLHDITRNRGETGAALSRIKADSWAIGIDTDLLYPAEEVKDWAAKLPNCRYSEIKSAHGHDAFLIEWQQLEEILGNCLTQEQLAQSA
jgi:homoserine O-acetyltransferase